MICHLLLVRSVKKRLSLPMDLLENIKNKRKRLGLSQADIAEKLGMTSQNYSLLENGKTELTYNKMLKLSEIFGVSLGEFLSIESNQSEKQNEIDKSEKDALEREVKLHRELKEKQDTIEQQQQFLYKIAEAFEHSCFLSFFAWYTSYKAGSELDLAKVGKEDIDFWNRFFSLKGVALVFEKNLIFNSYYEERYQEFLKRKEKKELPETVYPFHTPPKKLAYDK